MRRRTPAVLLACAIVAALGLAPAGAEYDPLATCEQVEDASNTASGAKAVNTPHTCVGRTEAGDRDWYAFSVITSPSSTNTATVTVATAAAGAEVDIVVIDRAGADRSAECADDAPGTCVIERAAPHTSFSDLWRVGIVNADGGEGTYAVSVATAGTLDAGTCDASDSGNSAAQARYIGAAMACVDHVNAAGDVDWYWVRPLTLHQAGYAQLAVTALGAGATAVSLRVLDPSGADVTGTACASDPPGTCVIERAAHGDWKVAVVDEAGARGVYTLAVSSVPYVRVL